MKTKELEKLKTQLFLHISDAKVAARDGKSSELHLEFAEAARSEIAALLGCEPAEVSCYLENKTTKHILA